MGTDNLPLSISQSSALSVKVQELNLSNQLFSADGAAQSFDRGDIRAVGLGHEHGAGFHRFAVHRDRAGTAVRCFASDVRTGDVQAFAQGVDQQFTRFGQKLLFLAIHRQFDVHLFRHIVLLRLRAGPRASDSPA